MKKIKGTLNFLENVAFHILEGDSSMNLPAIALQGLEEGYDTPSVLILAGFSKKESPFLIDEYFNLMLKDLNIKLVDKRDAAVFLIKSQVKKISEEQIDVYDACDFIFKQVLALTNIRQQDKNFVYDSIGLEIVYSLYITIWELMNTGQRTEAIKSNGIITEAKQQIKEKLNEWSQYFTD